MIATEMRCSRIGDVCASGCIYLDTPINILTYARTYVCMYVYVCVRALALIFLYVNPHMLPHTHNAL